MTPPSIRQRLIEILDTEAISEARLTALVNFVSLIDHAAYDDGYEEGFSLGYRQGSDKGKPQ